jgi:hypothetical protein
LTYRSPLVQCGPGKSFARPFEFSAEAKVIHTSAMQQGGVVVMTIAEIVARTISVIDPEGD